MDLVATLAIALALAWATGVRLYAVLFLVGCAGYAGWFGWTIPPGLELLAHPLVIGANAILLILEFFANKIPGIDSIWDVIHTVLKVPVGALLAAGVVGADDGLAWALAAALLGGTITAGTHFIKAGSRAAINTSPEPMSNWAASFAEDAAVLGGLWLAVQHPMIFLGLLIAFVLLAIWAIPKLWRAVTGLIRRGLGGGAATNPNMANRA